MKKIFTLLAFVLLSANVFAQAPQKMSYQAVIRNSSGALVANTPIGMQISILQGSASGMPMYTETQRPTTNENGLVSLAIGSGSLPDGGAQFESVDWSQGPYFIKTETDPTGGTNYSITGTSELTSVPYALFALNSTSGPQGEQGIQGEPGPTGATGSVANVGIISATSIPNGASISNGILSLAPADETNPGIITSGSQTFSGIKKFQSIHSDSVVINGGIFTDFLKADGSLDTNTYLTTTGTAATVTTNADLTGPILSEGNTTSVASQTGLGSTFVMDSSPTLVTPDLGVATATSINGTSIPSSKTVVVTTDKLNALATTSSTELAEVLSDETGTGSLVLANSPSLVTPDLGVATATSINGTSIPSSKTVVVTTDKLNVLSTTSSTELAGVLSDETGTGSLVLANSPILVTPNLGTPSAVTLTSATGLPLTTAVVGVLPVINGGTGQSSFVNGELLIGNSTANTLTKRTLTAGTGISVTNGNGAITIASTSPLPSSNTAGDMLYWNGSAWVKVAAGTNGQMLTFLNGIPTWIMALNPVIPTVVSVSRIWMDRNLGASQVATSSSDSAGFGDLYQWGRSTDGHQLRNSGTTGTISTTDQPGSANFVIITSSPFDWRSGQNNNLWQGVYGVNNPCPIGFRLPTNTEWNSEKANWGGNQNGDGGINSPLKLPMAGYRLVDDNPSTIDGAIWQEGYRGYYWSSTISGTASLRLAFANGPSVNSFANRVEGNSVRCIKD